MDNPEAVDEEAFLTLRQGGKRSPAASWRTAPRVLLLGLSHQSTPAAGELGPQPLLRERPGHQAESEGKRVPVGNPPGLQTLRVSADGTSCERATSEGCDKEPSCQGRAVPEGEDENYNL